MAGVDDLEAAGAALRIGRLVVLPTDTVYGVGALPRSRGGVAGIFAAKGRSQRKAIPVLAASSEDLADVVVLDDRARALARSFWPGPLTLVVRRNPAWPYDLGGSDASTIAVRVPQNSLALALLERTGPLAVTSANRSDEPAATTVALARSALGDAVAVYLDGGVCDEAPSSVVSLVGEVRMLREGPVSLDAIYKVTE
ncbi:MAG: L-threonylcarbamoyladenylate synthase [Actinomycetota bacterium]|nr:L-threonylcarbamoyladenylate synthase [Actinomycetota bacterium]